MDTFKQLADEAQQLREKLEVLERAIENRSEMKRCPELWDTWEDQHGAEFLCIEVDREEGGVRMIGIDTGNIFWRWFDQFSTWTFKRKAEL